jgi:hypothetical protein
VWTCYRYYGGEPSTLQVFHQTAYKAHLPEQLQAVVPEYNDEQDVVKVCSKLLEKLIVMPEIGERVKDDLRMLDEVVAAVVTVRVEDAFLIFPQSRASLPLSTTQEAQEQAHVGDAATGFLTAFGELRSKQDKKDLAAADSDDSSSDASAALEEE